MPRFCSLCRTSWWAERSRGSVLSYDCRTSAFRCANLLYIYCRDPDRKSAWEERSNLYGISFREHSPCCKSAGKIDILGRFQVRKLIMVMTPHIKEEMGWKAAYTAKHIVIKIERQWKIADCEIFADFRQRNQLTWKNDNKFPFSEWMLIPVHIHFCSSFRTKGNNSPMGIRRV